MCVCAYSVCARVCVHACVCARVCVFVNVHMHVYASTSIHITCTLVYEIVKILGLRLVFWLIGKPFSQNHEFYCN